MQITEKSRRPVPSGLLSLALHICVLALVLVAGNAKKTPLIEPHTFQPMTLMEIAGGSHPIPVPLPSAEVAARTRKPTADTEVSHKTILPIPQPQPLLAGGGTPQDPHHGDGSGSALFGNGADAQDARPSFPTYSPKPPVHDRSLLPKTEMKIVVDVDIDAQGQVVRETLVKGMGNNLDQIVLGIVLTWRFQPATLNGKPIPSESELIFPFNTNYPLADS